MKQLTYDQKQALAAYKYFYGVQYQTNSGQNNTGMHVAAQKMCYLLKVIGVDIGDYEYAWNKKGPFSPGLLALLRSVDRNEELVNAFYAQLGKEEDVLKTKAKKIAQLRDRLDIIKHKNAYVAWVEILGSLAYISRTVLPGKGFKEVNERFVREKEAYNNKRQNLEAWRLLKKAKVLSSFS